MSQTGIRSADYGKETFGFDEGQVVRQVKVREESLSYKTKERILGGENGGGALNQDRGGWVCTQRLVDIIAHMFWFHKSKLRIGGMKSYPLICANLYEWERQGIGVRG